ncbi:MAG: lysostaphin resistance A-like protein [Gemmataceae bacterium]
MTVPVNTEQMHDITPHPGCWRRFLVRWMPPQRQRAVPWGALEVVFVFLAVNLWPVMMTDVLNDWGFFQWLYGSELLAEQEGGTEKVLNLRLHIWASLVAFPGMVATIVMVPWLISGTRPYQLGLTGHRFLRNLDIGIIGFFILTPLAYGVLMLCILFYGVDEPHPFTQVMQQQVIPGEWWALVLVAMVVAPVWEEMFFRGLLQRWLTRHQWGGAAAVAASLLLVYQLGKPPLAWQEGRLTILWLNAAPLLFVLALLPMYGCIHRYARTPIPGAIFGSALLFAVGHSAWPQPVALFVLGLGLGWMAQRTQSLVGPIVVHSLFNGVACVMLLVSPPPAG